MMGRTRKRRSILFSEFGVARTRTSLSRSEEHTSELQSLTNLVCRLLLEKKKKCNRSYGQSRRQPTDTRRECHDPARWSRRQQRCTTGHYELSTDVLVSSSGAVETLRYQH